MLIDYPLGEDFLQNFYYVPLSLHGKLEMEIKEVHPCLCILSYSESPTLMSTTDLLLLTNNRT